MKLVKLLETHKSCASDSDLHGNLGDGYLCRHNSVYRAVRQAAISAGYIYTDNPDTAYAVLPLSQLDSILIRKEIPYFNNVGVLSSVESKIPGLTDWADIRDNLKKNFLFHETCHAVAHSLASEVKSPDRLLSFLLEESFANTCELLGIVEASDTAHKIFYEWNSYTALHEHRRNLELAAQDVGREVLVRWILLSYLHANFLFEQFSEDQFNRVLKLAAGDKIKSLSPSQTKTLRALAKICFGLDEQFKRVTTGFYLKLNHMRSASERLGKFGYFEELEKNTSYRDYIGQLTRVLITE